MKKILNFLIVFLAILLLCIVLSGAIYEMSNIGTVSDLIYYEAVAATCTEDGSVEYWYDSVSGKYYADKKGSEELESVVIEATGHNYDRSGVCASCGETIEGLNAWGGSTASTFVFNGKTLDNHTIYYLTDEDSCYYMEYGVKYYIYTAADIANGVTAVSKSVSSDITGGWCEDGKFGLGVIWADDGSVYLLYNLKAPHEVGSDGYCTECGEYIGN